MSRSTVRTAVADWFAAGDVPGLQKIHRNEPFDFWGTSFFPDGGDTGVVMYVHIDGESERRVTTPAQAPGVVAASAAGWKEITYRVGLVINAWSLPKNDAGDEDASVLAMDDFDALIEAVKARAREDRTLGGAVYSLGTGGPTQADDIVVVSDMPGLWTDGYVHIRSVVQFTVTDWLRA